MSHQLAFRASAFLPRVFTVAANYSPAFPSRLAAAPSLATLRAVASTPARPISSTPASPTPSAAPSTAAKPDLSAFPFAGIMPASTAQPQMACFQCEQTKDVKACTTVGVCGKTPDTSAAQDALMHLSKSVAWHAARLSKLNNPANSKLILDAAAFLQDAIFATLTNVNFHFDRFTAKDDGYISQALAWRAKLKDAADKAGAPASPFQGKNAAAGMLDYVPNTSSHEALIAESKNVSGVIPRAKAVADPDVTSLQELLIYGIKGMAAYADHAHEFGKESPKVAEYLMRATAYLAADKQDVPTLLGLAMECGEKNLTTMGMLNEGAIDRFGKPQPTKVLLTPKKGPAILVSGHDLIDLEKVLKATQGTGVNVYTHGELLPAHGYPGLKQKYPHLVGNFGGAWQLQKFEFGTFPGPILMTTNCILEPRKSYKDRIYTVHSVGFEGTKHLSESDDYSLLVEQAKQMKGFPEDVKPEQYTLTGFGHHAVLGVADKVIQAVKDGKIKRFFLIGGCDGSEGERSYYADLARTVPKDCVVMTLACGKYRFNKHYDDWFGEIEGTGIPRLLDVGQCNDAYSAVQIAGALAQAFKTDVNHLPLSIVLSWFEQKAVAVLLSLLNLGIENIRIGPRLPAFVSPNVLQVLVDKYKVKPIGTVEEDLKAMMQGK